MELRNYQTESIEAVERFLAEQDGSPVIVLPTGAGKSVVMAELARRVVARKQRTLVLAHVQELVQQNFEKFDAHAPELHAGLYSAGLNRRDTWQQVIFASIQSVYRRAQDLGHFDLVMIDEAHRIPMKGDGMYRSFLGELRAINPELRVIGLTATPYRLGAGRVYGKGGLLTDVAHDVSVGQLIDEGYLCQLRSFAGETPDLSDVHIRNGEYIESEVEAAVMNEAKMSAAIEQIVHAGRDRAAWLLFAASVKHADALSSILEGDWGIEAPVITATTPKPERKRQIERYQRGELRALVNVNVLSEGFDAPHVDLVAMLRPTQSPGLYYQQVGRGLRLHPAKADCLVLDFAGNIITHGPIDGIEPKEPGERRNPGDAPMKECPDCHALVHTAVRVCPECGYLWPEPKLKHGTTPDIAPILGKGGPATLDVLGVEYSRHIGQSGIPTLRVDYVTDSRTVSEFVCFEHDGYARQKAAIWWRDRTPTEWWAWCPDRIEDVLEATQHAHFRAPSQIEVVKDGKYLRVSRSCFGAGVANTEEAAAESA